MKSLELIDEIENLVDGIQGNEKNVESIQEILEELRELITDDVRMPRVIFQNNNCKTVNQEIITKGTVYIDD